MRILIMHGAQHTAENISNSIRKASAQALVPLEIHTMHVKQAPTFELVYQYDAILYDSVQCIVPSVLLGNLMAHYLREGGALVACAFSNRKPSSQCLAGEFETLELHPMYDANAVHSVDLGIGKVVLPEHAIMHRVASFDAPLAARVTATVRGTATLVAEWKDGIPLVSYQQKPGFGMVVSLNMSATYFQSGTKCSGWHVETDGILNWH